MLNRDPHYRKDRPVHLPLLPKGANVASYAVPYKEGIPAPSASHILCGFKGEPDTRFWVPHDKLRLDPIQHDDLGPIAPMVRWVWRHLRKQLGWCHSFEAWELGFLRETDPTRELKHWVRITYAYLQFRHEVKYRVCPKSVFVALVYLTSGRAAFVKPKSFARRLSRLYDKKCPRYLFSDPERFAADGQLEKGPAHLR